MEGVSILRFSTCTVDNMNTTRDVTDPQFPFTSANMNLMCPWLESSFSDWQILGDNVVVVVVVQ